MINYFSYDYEQPKDGDPFSVNTELGECPWNKNAKLLLVGLQGLEIDLADAPPSNLVFLIDVSGSMSNDNKLPLLVKVFKILVEQLRAKDRVAMVVYAGASGLVLESTPGDQKKTIVKALDKLQSGGSTAGAEGINLAYKVAAENFIKGGNNRVILATDGDFNVGASSDEEMQKLIETKRDEGVFLSVLGFGMGNYKDSKMEILADKGNGNYAYIDSLREAEKVFSTQLTSTLLTIAKDVKLQLEFNPVHVRAYRLVGYENRVLAREDFANDKIDAGELGAGHQVTALYEVILGNSVPQERSDLKYSTVQVMDIALTTDELLTVNLRYKKSDENKSKLTSHVVNSFDLENKEQYFNLSFASAVAEFGMILRRSRYLADANPARALERVMESLEHDQFGYRAELADLIKKYISIVENLNSDE